MYRAKDIAQLFVLKGINESQPISPMKLQKMIYFAHGLYLIDAESPLINDEVEAWQFGPVIPSVYKLYAQFRNEPIADENTLRLLGIFSSEIPQLDEKAQTIINGTWDALKDISAIQLSNWSHRPDSAWSKVYNGSERHIPISNAEIKADLQRFVTQSERNNETVGQ